MAQGQDSSVTNPGCKNHQVEPQRLRKLEKAVDFSEVADVHGLLPA